MYKKTSNASFLLYGNPTASFLEDKTLIQHKATKYSKKIQRYYSYSSDSYVRIEEGIGLLVIYDDKKYEFLINSQIKINKDVKFSIIPIDDHVKFTIYHKQQQNYKHYNYNDDSKKIEQKFRLNNIYSYSYSDIKALNSEYKPNKYYELIFIDCGSCLAMINDQQVDLEQNDICIIDLANTSFKTIETSKQCNCLHMIFDSEQPIDQSMLNKHIHATKNILELIKPLANNVNKDYEYDLYLTTLQLIIISLLQKNTKKIPPASGPKAVNYYDNDSFRKIVSFIDENLDSTITIELLCHRFGISHGSIINLFNENLNITYKKYLTDARLRKSKELIRSQHYSIDDIASKLGFRSTYYFSKKFYELFGLTVNEYARKTYQD